MSQTSEATGTPPAPSEAAPKPSSDAWWRARFKEHPFKATSLAVLTIGGLSLLAFFIHLGVMPDLDLAGASATMAAVAMIGLLVGAALGGSTLAAGVTTHDLINSQPDVFQSRWTVGAFAAPSIIGFLAFAALATWCENWKFSEFGLWVAGLMVALVLARAVTLWRSGAFKLPAGTSSNRLLRAFEIIMGLLGGGVIWLMMPLLATLSFIALWPSDRSSAEFGIYLAAWGLLCVAMNVFVSHWPKERELSGMLFMGVSAVFLLMVLTQNWSGIPLAAVRTLGLGETPVALVLTEQGCHTLNKAARGQTICQLDATTKMGWACPVLLKSRIGSPFVIEVTSFDTDGKWPAQLPIAQESKSQPPLRALRYPRIQIPKADVLSWPTINALKSPGGNFHFDARQLASVWHQDMKKMSPEQTEWLLAQCGEQRVTETPGKTEPSAQTAPSDTVVKSPAPKSP